METIDGKIIIHDKTWLKKILSRAKNKVVVFEKSSHWLMRDETKKLNYELVDFLTNY